MANYLHAHPGFPQKIGTKIFTIKWMYSEETDAKDRITRLRKEGVWKEVRLYPRKINGKLFGKHPWCVAVRGKLKRGT